MAISVSSLLLGALIVTIIGFIFLILFVRPWIKSIKNNFDSSQRAIREKMDLEAEQIRHQTELEKIQTLDIAAEAEDKKTRLLEKKTANADAEIEIRNKYKDHGIDPDCAPPKPKCWIRRHKFWTAFALFWIFIVVISILYEKGIIR